MAKKNTFGFKTVEQAFKESYQLQTSLAVKKALELVETKQYQNATAAWPEALEYGKAEAKNYVLERKNNLMAFWEGICHGWATAAGIVPRPRKTVSFELPDGRNLKFYPSDIKALISLLWANSLIQDNKVTDQNTGEYLRGGVIPAGNRCHASSIPTDRWGRRYDDKKDPVYGDHVARCAGVHPAIFHLSLINLIGKQSRSFIADVKVNEEVDNHPVYGYSMKYFHPNNGRFYKKIDRNVIKIGRRDQFKDFRNPKAKYIVGVETKMRYLDWTRPKRYTTDHESFDKSEIKKMFYDLELDENYNIVGGQWRAKKYGSVVRNQANDKHGRHNKLNHNQPDFIWVITKHWKQQFKEVEGLEAWSDRTKAPPKSWFKEVKTARDFKYQERYFFGNGQKCKHYHKKTGKMIKVACEFVTPKPQPLINIVNELIKRSQE